MREPPLHALLFLYKHSIIDFLSLLYNLALVAILETTRKNLVQSQVHLVSEVAGHPAYYVKDNMSVVGLGV